MQNYIEICCLQNCNYIHCFLLLVIDIPIKYKTIHCRLTNKSSVCNKLYHTIIHQNISINSFINLQKLYSVVLSQTNDNSLITQNDLDIKILMIFSFIIIQVNYLIHQIFVFYYFIIDNHLIILQITHCLFLFFAQSL